MERAFTGFEALPHLPDNEPWHVVLKLEPTAPPAVVKEQYRRLRSVNHPDRGGDASQFARINEAWEQYQQEHS